MRAQKALHLFCLYFYASTVDDIVTATENAKQFPAGGIVVTHLNNVIGEQLGGIDRWGMDYQTTVGIL